MFNYIIILIWIIMGIFVVRFRMRNTISIIGTVKRRKTINIVYYIVTTLLAFIVFMNISANGFSDIISLVVGILGIIVMGLIFTSKDGISEKGIIILFIVFEWSKIKACTLKKEDNKCVLYYSTDRGYGNIDFNIEQYEEVKKFVKGKTILTKEK